MAWIPLAIQALQYAPTLIETGIKLSNAIMQEPAVSEEDKAALLVRLEAERVALADLVNRVKASRFVVPQ